VKSLFQRSPAALGSRVPFAALLCGPSPALAGTILGSAGGAVTGFPPGIVRTMAPRQTVFWQAGSSPAT
jgi:hypothetical protein